jgi:hypothetical protein
MLPDPKIRCPATGFAKSCREILAECDCPKWVAIAGTNPNTGEAVNREGCIDSFLPMLLLENAKVQRETGAALESFRNEVVNVNGRALDLQERAILAIQNGGARRLT